MHYAAPGGRMDKRVVTVIGQTVDSTVHGMCSCRRSVTKSMTDAHHFISTVSVTCLQLLLLMLRLSRLLCKLPSSPLDCMMHISDDGGKICDKIGHFAWTKNLDKMFLVISYHIISYHSHIMYHIIIITS